MNNQNLKTKIEEALSSTKVDPYIKHSFNTLIEQQPNVDLTKSYVPFLARGTREDIKVKGISSQMGNIYSMMVPYSQMPDLVENPDFTYFEASR